MRPWRKKTGFWKRSTASRAGRLNPFPSVVRLPAKRNPPGRAAPCLETPKMDPFLRPPTRMAARLPGSPSSPSSSLQQPLRPYGSAPESPSQAGPGPGPACGFRPALMSRKIDQIVPRCHRLPWRVSIPCSFNWSAIACQPWPASRLRAISARTACSPGSAPKGFAPSHRPSRPRARSRAARSFLTMTDFSHCASAPSICRIRIRVGSPVPSVSSSPRGRFVNLDPEPFRLTVEQLRHDQVAGQPVGPLDDDCIDRRRLNTPGSSPRTLGARTSRPCRRPPLP